MSSTMKILSAAAVAGALLATVAVAHTVRSHTAPDQISHASTTGAMPSQTPPSLHGNIACPTTFGPDCSKVETWYPE